MSEWALVLKENLLHLWWKPLFTWNVFDLNIFSISSRRRGIKIESLVTDWAFSNQCNNRHARKSKPTFFDGKTFVSRKSHSIKTRIQICVKWKLLYCRPIGQPAKCHNKPFGYSMPCGARGLLGVAPYWGMQQKEQMSCSVLKTNRNISLPDYRFNEWVNQREEIIYPNTWGHYTSAVTTNKKILLWAETRGENRVPANKNRSANHIGHIPSPTGNPSVYGNPRMN